MSVFQAPPTSKPEEEEASEAVPPLTDRTAPSMPGAIVEYDVGSGTAVTLPPQPIRPGIRATRVGAVEKRPVPAASALYLHSPQHHPQRPNLLESARLEREIAREMHPSSEQWNQKTRLTIASALASMSTQRLFILVTGVLSLTGGLLALRFPVFLSDFDQWGFQINCGSGLQSMSTQAGIADSAGTNFIDQCHTAIAMRRAWTTALVAAGVLLLGALLVRPSREQSANTETTRDIPLGRLSWSPPYFLHTARVFLIKSEWLTTRHGGRPSNAL
ncbi:MAG: hypothetical protein J2P17_08290 [Mycobacterium sp.]|nr:hypothetical protein [Mycobacterium sp.]